MKKNLLYGATRSLKTGVLFLSLFLSKASISQTEGDYRSRLNNSGFGGASTWEVYSATTGAWSTATAAPSATTNVLIRDGATHTSNVSGGNTANLVIGEGNAAILSSAVNGAGEVTAVTVVNPGKLAFLSAPIFVGPGTTLATATISSATVTGTSLTNPGAGYTSATVTFAAAPAGGTTAEGTAVIGEGGKITGITVTNAGAGYITVPSITIAGDGTGAVFTSLMGIQTLNITNAGAGYVTPPQVLVGTIFMVGNATTARSLTVNGNLTLRNGANIISGGGSASVTQTLNLTGDLVGSSPINFITQVPTSNSSTTVNFTKVGTATVSGATASFRNISVGASTVLQVNSAINIAGTIGLNSTGQIDASNGDVGFNTYSTPLAQTVAAATFKDGLIRNLVINNTSGVTFNQSIIVSNMLTMQAGILTLPATAGSLQINGINPIGGSSFGATTHINTASDAGTGAIAIVQLNNVTDSRLIPLGNGGNYLPVTVSPSSISSFLVNVFTGATDNGLPNGTPTADKTNIVDAIYTVNRSSGTGNVILTLGFPASLKGSGFNSIQNNQLGLSKNNNGNWEAVTGNGDNTQNFAMAQYSTFSPFRVMINLNPTTLPVKLSGFTATKANGQIVLNWKVTGETNLKGYDVERSVDGRNFASIGVVKASGKSIYTLTDANPSTGKNFYRLKTVDNDSRAAISSILLVDLGRKNASLNVYPNPVTRGFFTVRFGNMNAGKVMVKMFTTTGQLVMDEPISYNGNSDNQLINLPAGIAKGNYHLVITDGSNSQKASVIVQ